MLLLTMLVPGAPAGAASLQWDANGTLPVNGNSTTPALNVWDTTNLRWFNGVSYQLWNNAALDDAVFSGTAGAVTLGTDITAHNLTFTVNNYTLSGNPLTLAGVNPTLSINTGTTTINSIIAGSAGLIKAGTGQLALGGSNTYTGVTTVQGGTLTLNNVNALGAAPNLASNFVIANGAVIAFNANINRDSTLTGGVVRMQGNATYSGSPTLSASTELQLTGAGTFSGNLADTGTNVLSVTKPSTGTVILSGTNTYSGATTLAAGNLRLSSAEALSANSNLRFNGIGTTPGILELDSGDVTRALGTGANQVQWTGNGGFYARSGNRIVNLGGAGATLNWGSSNFVPTGSFLVLGTKHQQHAGFPEWHRSLRRTAHHPCRRRQHHWPRHG